MKYFGWAVFIFFAAVIGLYPFLYLIFNMQDGFLSSKPRELILDRFWNTAFYVHIITGGIALLIGPTQFSKRIRLRYVRFHRVLGKCYLVSVITSGVSALYIALYATGGLIATAGFEGLAIAWLLPRCKPT